MKVATSMIGCSSFDRRTEDLLTRPEPFYYLALVVVFASPLDVLISAHATDSLSQKQVRIETWS
jgi:hypothetical protein